MIRLDVRLSETEAELVAAILLDGAAGRLTPRGRSERAIARRVALRRAIAALAEQVR